MDAKIKKIGLTGLLVFLGLAFLAVAVMAADEPIKLIRVAVQKDITRFNLSIKGKYQLLESKNEKVLSDEKNLWDALVSGSPEGLRIGTQLYNVARIRIIPQKDGQIYVNNRQYRGEVDILAGVGDLLSVVNIVELEDYIKGVMYHEVSHHWPLECLKAQAVAARTYALFQMRANVLKDYDVTSDIYSQVYGGRGSERYRTNLAVDRTKGLVMTYKDNLLLAYYHATCGGYTEDARELWKQEAALPLRGVKCDYCQYSPHYHWKRNFQLKEIQEKLNQKGFSLGLIKEIAVLDRNKSERIKTLQITTRDGKKVKISGKDFRDIIGPNLIKSNNYDIVMQGYYMDLIGKGWGHGVGMCQWGASEMAREGYSYEQILRYYYPGIGIASSTLF